MSSEKKGPVTVPLSVPIKRGSEQITELTFRRPKAKDFRRIPVQGQTIGDILDLAARLCGQPPSVIDEVDADDLEEVATTVGNFMPGSLETGSTS